MCSSASAARSEPWSTASNRGCSHPIPAITVTDKAAAELRDRVRQELQRRAAAEPGTAVSDRCLTALDQLDGAAIGTLHSFAQRILAEHPVEAGLPPRVEVLDEVSSGVAFERRWATFRDQLLADPELERTLLLLLASGVQEKALRALADAFDDNWDLVDERVPADAPEPPRVQDALADALAPVDAACAATSHCVNGDDRLLARLDEIAEYAARLRSCDDEIDLLEMLADDSVPKPPSFRVGNLGRAGWWPGVDLGELKAQIRAAGDGV